MKHFDNAYAFYTGRRLQYLRAIRLWRWIWKTCVVLYFIIGFILLATRYLLIPYANEHTNDIAQYLSKTAGIDIQAGNIETQWDRLWPQIILTDVKLARPGGPVSLALPLVQAELSWSSIWHLEPRFRVLSISNPNIAVHRLSETSYDIAGFVVKMPPSEQTSEHVDTKQPFTSWLLGQSRLQILNGTFVYTDETMQTPLPIRITNAQFLFEEGLLSWQAALKGQIESRKKEPFDIRARLDKTLFLQPNDPRSWRGEIYSSLGHIDAARFLKRLGYHNVIRSGNGNVRLWLAFNQGRATNITADIALTKVHTLLSPKLEALRLRWLTGRVSYTEKADEQIFKAENFQFKTQEGDLFDPAMLSVRRVNNAAGEPVELYLGASIIDIGTLSQLAPALPVPSKFTEFLKQHPLRGHIKNLNATVNGPYTEPANWHVDLSFEHLTLPTSQDNLPGFTNLSGNITGSIKEGGFQLASKRSSLIFPNIFRTPQIGLKELKLNGHWSALPYFSIFVENFSIANNDAVATGKVSWQNSGGAGTIDLTGDIASAKATSVVKYLPNVIGDATLDYLSAAILGGTGSKGRFIVKGALNEFPWSGKNKNKGQFLITMQASNGTFDFLPSQEKNQKGQWITATQWPLLTDIDASLRFEGDSMLITSNKTQSQGLAAKNVSVSIPSFAAHPVMLKIRGDIGGDLKNALAYLNESKMLHDILGGAFDQSSGNGNTDVALSLDIPLATPQKLKLSLDAALENANFIYNPLLPEMNNVTGKLHITEQGVNTTTPFSGKTSNGDASVTVTTDQDTVELRVKALAAPNDAIRLLKNEDVTPFLNKVSGTTDIDVNVAINLTGQGISITGRSSGIGLASTLPAPFNKNASDQWPTTFTYTPKKDNAYRLAVESPNHVALILEGLSSTDGHQLSKGYIGIGAPMKAITQGLNIAVKTPFLSISEWKPYVDGFLHTGKTDFLAPAKNTPQSTIFNTITANIDQLEVEGKTFTDIDLTARRFNRNDWHLRVGSDLVSGQAEMHAATPERPMTLSVKLDRLYLPESPRDKIEALLDETPLESLPDLVVTVDDLKIDKIAVGKVELAAHNTTLNTKPAWQLTNLKVSNAGGVLTGKGIWAQDDTEYGNTTITLNATITDLGRVLQSLDINDAIHRAPGKLSAQLSWMGAPYRPLLNTMSGMLHTNLKAGQLLQVEPGAGRLLSLLSMQHLLKRLTLDFRDVLNKGFAFDSCQFDAEINQGILHTNRAIISGAIATVVTDGDIDLPKETLNLRVLVVPDINAGGASLALAIANPAVGIGSFIAQWLLKDQLSNLFSMEYSVKGTFDDPDIKKVTRTGVGNVNATPR